MEKNILDGFKLQSMWVMVVILGVLLWRTDTQALGHDGAGTALQPHLEALMIAMEMKLLAHSEVNIAPRRLMIGSFIDERTQEQNRLCKEMERTIEAILQRRLLGRPDIVLRNRAPIVTPEKAALPTNDPAYGQSGAFEPKSKSQPESEPQPEPGLQPGADWLLIGSVLLAGANLQLRTQLIDMISGRLVTSGAAAVPLADIDSSWLADSDGTHSVHVLSARVTVENQAAQWMGIGLAAMTANQFHEAVLAFSNILHQDAEQFDALYHRGLAFYQLGWFDKAVIDFNKLLDNRSDQAEVHYNRGLAYFQNGEIAAACRDFRKACELGCCKGTHWAEDKGLCR
jgi:Flp pilus assembly protein TadD